MTKHRGAFRSDTCNSWIAQVLEVTEATGKQVNNLGWINRGAVSATSLLETTDSIVSNRLVTLTTLRLTRPWFTQEEKKCLIIQKICTKRIEFHFSTL